MFLTTIHMSTRPERFSDLMHGRLADVTYDFRVRVHEFRVGVSSLDTT